MHGTDPEFLFNFFYFLFIYLFFYFFFIFFFSIVPDFFVSSLYFSVAIKVRFFKFNRWNRYKSNISRLVLVFF